MLKYLEIVEKLIKYFENAIYEIGKQFLDENESLADLFVRIVKVTFILASALFVTLLTFEII